MRTICYCVGCKKHPKHDRRGQFKTWLTGYFPGNMIWASYAEQSSQVECLRPISPAFEAFGITPEDFSYPVTAYADGGSVTGAEESSFTIFASCGDEDHEN